MKDVIPLKNGLQEVVGASEHWIPALRFAAAGMTISIVESKSLEK